jgi:hypothetical protein
MHAKYSEILYDACIWLTEQFAFENLMQNTSISSLVTQVNLAVQIISTRVISFMPKYWQKIRFENSFSGSVPQQSLSVRVYVSVLHARGNPFCGLRPEVGSVHGTDMACLEYMTNDQSFTLREQTPNKYNTGPTKRQLKPRFRHD